MSFSMADIIITCEHSSPHIPNMYRDKMLIPHDIEEHRIYDKGAFEAAENFACIKGGSVIDFPCSRLLIDANRSITNSSLFSKYSAELPSVDRYILIEEIYTPFRMKTVKAVEKCPKAIHLSFHSYTPVLNGKARNYDAGILYDPSRGEEAKLAGDLIKHMNSHGIKTVANRPYKGTADGHTTALRKEFPAGRYIGIEIELSQKFSVKEMIDISTEIASFF